jgi:hypothetical protein
MFFPSLSKEGKSEAPSERWISLHNGFPLLIEVGACKAGGVVERRDQTTPALRAAPPYPRRGNPTLELRRPERIKVEEIK